MLVESSWCFCFCFHCTISRNYDKKTKISSPWLIRLSYVVHDKKNKTCYTAQWIRPLWSATALIGSICELTIGKKTHNMHSISCAKSAIHQRNAPWHLVRQPKIQVNPVFSLLALKWHNGTGSNYYLRSSLAAGISQFGVYNIAWQLLRPRLRLFIVSSIERIVKFFFV